MTFEGLDGSGKTTQVGLLREHLEGEGHLVVATREPGGTELGDSIRELLLHSGDVSPWAEAALFAASRAQLVAEVIRPALRGGAIVLCDRYVDSSLAYQGIARGLGLETVLQLNLAAVGELLPDRTFLFLLDPDAAAARLAQTRDRIEREDDAFRGRVDTAYRELAALFPERILALDGSRDPAEIAAEVRAALALGG